MKAITTLALFVLLAASSGSAVANCIYNGQSYPTGTSIRGVTCQPNGTWA
jgi:hypothetical protein